MTERPTRLALGLEVAALAAALVVSVLSNGWSDWDLPLLLTLTALSIISDLIAIETRVSRVAVSASLMTIVIGAVLLGGAPAALMGVITIGAGWLKHRYELHHLLINLVTYAWFPLIAGIVFHVVSDAGGIEHRQPRLLPADHRRLRPRARDRLRPDRRLLVLRRALQLPDQGAAGPPPRAPVRARGLDAGARVRRRLRPGRDRRGRPAQRDHPGLPVHRRCSARLPGPRGRARAARPPARGLSGRAALRAAADARPARPDDRSPQRRRRPLLAGDRGREPASRPRTRSSSTPPVCCTTSASSCSPTTS